MRVDWLAEFSLAGMLSSVEPIGTWWASVPKERWSDDIRVQRNIRNHWQEPWGDWRQEIVCIGSGIDWPALRSRLDAALLPEVAATGPNTLPDLPDPFSVWRLEDDTA